MISFYRKTWEFSDKEFRPSSLTGADQKFLSRFGWQLPPSFFLLGFTFLPVGGFFYTSFRRLIPIAPSCQSKVVGERYWEVSDPQISVAWTHYYVVSHYLLLTLVFLSTSLPISSTTDSDSLSSGPFSLFRSFSQERNKFCRDLDSHLLIAPLSTFLTESRRSERPSSWSRIVIDFWLDRHAGKF